MSLYRDRSLITKRGGGAIKLKEKLGFKSQKKEADKVVAMLKVGGGVDLT